MATLTPEQENQLFTIEVYLRGGASFEADVRDIVFHYADEGRTSLAGYTQDFGMSQRRIVVLDPDEIIAVVAKGDLLDLVPTITRDHDGSTPQPEGLRLVGGDDSDS